MSSATVSNTTVQSTLDRHPDALTTTSEAKEDHPVSPPASAPKLGDTLNPTITKPQSNGDPMDWESWPTGRPGPFVHEYRMQLLMDVFKHLNEARDEQSRTKEQVLHVAEFSSSGREIFVGHVTEPELATRLEKPHPESRFRLLFPTTQRGAWAVLSTSTQRILSACGAPAAVWDTLPQESTSPLHSFIDSRDGNTVFHAWMSLRFQWKRSPDGFQLLLEPYLGIVQKWLGTATVYPKLYFCYNAMTQQTTILTTDLNRSHLWMIQHLKGLSGMYIRPEEVGRLLIQHFVMVQECFTATAVVWDERANGPQLASKTLDSSADHNASVRIAELDARLADMIRGDFIVFQSAFTSLEEYLEDFWRILNLDPAVKESFGALFMKRRKQSEVTKLLHDSIVTRYDRFLNLLLNYTNIRMVEGMKSVSEQTGKMTEEMKELAKRNADITAEMKVSTEQNAEATKRMAELAEVNRQQARSMAVLAYDAKRDSEVMKAVTIVTLIFLPATFVSTIFSMGFFNIDYDHIRVSRQGWIYLACTLPLTFVVLGVSLAWIIWTGRKKEKPIDHSASQWLAQVADTLKLGAGPREGV